MARRQIGQDEFRIDVAKSAGGSSLDEMSKLIDWTEIDRLCAGIYAATKGELAWPPLALFRALLLAVWHDLSDVKLADALADRASFRRFCGFSATEPTPERTAFVRFRAELVRRGLDRPLFASITRQLEAKGVAVRTGTLVDATLIASASIRHDDEARWAGHRSRKPVHGYKAHVATDAEGGLIRGVEVTTGNVHDAAELEAVLPTEPGDVAAEQSDGAGIRQQFAGDQIEQGGLAGAVRADDQPTFPRRDREVDLRGDVQAPERLAQGADGERAHGFGSASDIGRAAVSGRRSERQAERASRAAPGTRPSGMNTTIATKMAPSRKFQRST